jgi:hypothetical protein
MATTTTTTTTISSDGSLLRSGSTSNIKTSAGTWTISATTGAGGYQILLNGKSASGGSAVMLEVASKGELYAYNSLGVWYEWLNQGWTQTGNPNVLTVASKQLSVAQNAAPAPINLSAPVDSVYSSGQLSVKVASLPTDGQVLLSDGKTAVTKGQSISVSQLTGLQFKPTTNLASGSSSFTYTASDPAGTSKTGTVALVVSTATNPSSFPAPAGYSSSQLVGEDKFTSSSLDTTKWSPWLGQNGGRWNGGALALPNPYSSETLSGSPYNAEYYDPYPYYASSTNTSGAHLSGGDGLKITASPSTYFSSKDSDYRWASATISSTGHPSMILPATGGYVQITAKIPDSSNGAWPFIWLLGEGSNRTQNVDWEFGYTGAPNSKIALGVNDKTVSTPTAAVDLSQGYHTYGTKYVPGKSYSFYLDGAQIATTPTTNTGAFEVAIGLQMATAAASGWHTVSDPAKHPGPYTLAVSDVQVYHA